jgi:hypothetical protein
VPQALACTKDGIVVQDAAVAKAAVAFLTTQLFSLSVPFPF